MNFSEFKNRFLKEEIQEYPNTTDKMKPIVTVCIQTYNHEEYIEQCLDSVISQKTDFEYEISIGEDESSDATRAICKNYAKQYPEKIRLFLHNRKNNIKVGDVSTGLFPSLFNFYNSRGKFIAYCDGDDYWGDPQKLQKQVDFLESNPTYSMCFHRFNILKSGNSSFNPKQVTRDLEKEELLKVDFHPLIITFCFRKIDILPAEITEVINADSFLISLLGQKGRGKYIHHIKPAIYRFHQNGLYSSKQGEKRFLFEVNTYQILSNYYAAKPLLSSHFKKRAFDYQKMLINFYLKKFKWKKLFKTIKIIKTN